MLPRIPYDSLVLAAVVAELRLWVGSRVQRVWQPDPMSVALELHLAGRTSWLWIGWDAEFARAYLSPRKPPSGGDPTAFCMALRARIGDGRVGSLSQVGFDRVLEIAIDNHRLVVELMGKHSNAILVDSEGKVVSAGKSVGLSKSRRPVLSGRPYERPPNMDRPSILTVPASERAGAQGASPFLLKWLDSGGSSEDILRAVELGTFSPVFVPEYGAYPLSVAHLGYREVPRESISVALANHYDVAIPARQLELRKHRLNTHLERVRLARETAIADLESAEEAGKGAGGRQLKGELILAYQGQIQPGDRLLQAFDYEGSPVEIALDPEKSAVENANAYFDKARRAKGRLGFVHDQLSRQRGDLEAVQTALARLDEASVDELGEIETDARRRRWLTIQAAPTEKGEQPYGGRRVREILGPKGWTIIFGENAEANDHLTMRVAKPDDYWLHVRGSASAHVIVPTKRQPEKVPREVLEYAAKIAVKNSGQKHASYVPVDYTLRRYVRKVKGAAPGTVLYTHEKTLHVDAGT